MKIGIFGGAFNPVHHGHLAGAEEVRVRLNLNKIIFIPAGIPPHKNIKEIESEDRYKMVCLAIENNDFFETSDIEIKRSKKTKGPVWTFETIKILRRRYGKGLHFIIGADEALKISTWKESGKLLNLCRFIVMTRPGYDLTRLNRKLKGKMRIVKITGLDISASDIRKRVKKGLSIRYLVPPSVEEYIQRHRLYRE